MARNALATDTFTRADSGDLGSNWDGGYTACDDGQIVSNHVEPKVNVNHAGIETWNNTSVGDDQYASAYIERLSTAFAYVNAGVVCRASAPATQTGYSCQVQHDDIFIGKYVAGSFTLLASASHAISTLVNEDISLECVGTGLSGYANLVSLVSTTDSDLTSGRTGITWYGDTGAASADIKIDNFEMGDFGGGGGGGSASHGLILLGVGS